MTTEKLISKLAKMKAMAEGAKAIGSEAEAQAFANALQRMLIEHKLKMTDIEFATMEKEAPVVQRPMDAAKYAFRVRKQRQLWIEQLGTIIAEAHFCRLLIHGNSTLYSFVGRPEDIDVAEYLFVTLYRAADKISMREYERYRNEQRRRMIALLGDAGKRGKMKHAYGFRESFLMSFVARLHIRLQEERARHDSSTALMRINKSEAAVKDFIKNVPNAKPLKKPDYHPVGSQRGIEAANRVSIKANAMGEPPSDKLPAGSVRFTIEYRQGADTRNRTDLFVSTPGTDEEVARRYEDAHPGRSVYGVKIFATDAQ